MLYFVHVVKTDNKALSLLKNNQNYKRYALHIHPDRQNRKLEDAYLKRRRRNSDFGKVMTM